MMNGSDFQLKDLCSREATESDHSFLLELFASTREQELAVFGADENQKRAFVSMQYSAMSRCYPQAENRIIMFGVLPVGRTIVDRRPDELRLVDISIVPEFRNRGAGASIVNQLLEEGRRNRLPVRLHVFKYSDAVRFYERLGFRMTEDDGSYLKMEWNPLHNDADAD